MSKSRKIMTIILGLFLMGCGIALFVHDAEYILTGNTTDLNEILENGEEMPRDAYVTYTCWVSVGNYAETQQYLDGFIPLPGKTQEYAILTEADTIISAEISKKEVIDEMERLTDVDYTNEGEIAPVVLTGCLQTVGGDMWQILQEAFSDVDLQGEGITLTDYAIDTTKTRASQFGLELAVTVLGLFCIVASVRKRR